MQTIEVSLGDRSHRFELWELSHVKVSYSHESVTFYAVPKGRYIAATFRALIELDTKTIVGEIKEINKSPFSRS